MPRIHYATSPLRLVARALRWMLGVLMASPEPLVATPAASDESWLSEETQLVPAGYAASVLTSLDGLDRREALLGTRQVRAPRRSRVPRRAARRPASPMTAPPAVATSPPAEPPGPSPDRSRLTPVGP